MKPDLIHDGRSPAILAVGDLHGRLAPLEDFLRGCDRAGFLASPDTVAGGAQIVFLGDYIDRGAQSRPVLERVAALKAANPGRVHCLLGNHEMLALASLGDARRLLTRGVVNASEDDYEWTPHGREGGWCLVQEFGGLPSYGEAMHPRAPMGAFLRSLEPAVELHVGRKRALFVHAGVPVYVRDRAAFDAEADALRRLLADEVALTSPELDVMEDLRTGMSSMLWDRSIPRKRRLGVDQLPAALDVDFIVIGHTRQERITRYGRGVYAVDLSGQPALAALLLRPGHSPCTFLPDGRVERVP